MSLSSYLVTCLTEGGRFVSDFRLEPATTCPNNIEHIIDPSQTVVYQTTTLKKVQIFQGGFENQYYKALSYSFMPMAPGLNTFSINAYYSVTPRMITIYPTADNIGDLFSLYINSDVVVGTITANASTSDNFIVVDNDALSKIQKGMKISIKHGADVIDIDDCVGIVGNTIYLSNTNPENFIAGSDVMISLPYLDEIPIVNTDNIRIGSNTMYSIEVNEGSKIKVIYKNNGVISKNISFTIEMLWGSAPL